MFHRTERLFLRPCFPEDWQAILAGMGTKDVVWNLASAPWPYGEADARAFALREQGPRLPHFMVTVPGQGVAGSAGIGPDAETGLIQLGYWIAPAHQGRGYASEAARGVLEVARMLGHRRITASHFVDNPASGRVLRKAGFRPTGEIRPGYSRARGRADPVACYAIRLDGEASGDKPGGTDDDDGAAQAMRYAA